MCYFSHESLLSFEKRYWYFVLLDTFPTAWATPVVYDVRALYNVTLQCCKGNWKVFFSKSFVCHMQTTTACTRCKLFPSFITKESSLFSALFTSCCPHSPAPVPAPVLWEANSVHPSQSPLFPSFSFFPPALSTCVRGSVVYIPDILWVSMDHIHHVCRLSTNICWPFLFFSISTSINMHMYLQYKSVMFEAVWLSPPSCFLRLGPSSRCQYIFSRATEISVSLACSYVGFELVWGFSECETGLPLRDPWWFEAEPFHFLFYESSRMITTTTTLEIKKEPKANSQ